MQNPHSHTHKETQIIWKKHGKNCIEKFIVRDFEKCFCRAFRPIEYVSWHEWKIYIHISAFFFISFFRFGHSTCVSFTVPWDRFPVMWCHIKHYALYTLAELVVAIHAFMCAGFCWYIYFIEPILYMSVCVCGVCAWLAYATF